jgi:succinate dehydrogenase/fumarate reductase flavoprotein subunit
MVNLKRRWQKIGEADDGIGSTVTNSPQADAARSRRGVERMVMAKPPTKTNYDVIVVGSGASALTTAVVAADKGLEVLVVEKAPVFGGTTAYSSGGAWIPNNPYMGSVGQTDSAAEAHEYIHSILGNHYEAEKVGAFLDSGPEMLRYLDANTQVRFYPLPLSDYRPSAPSAKLARTIIAAEFDGRALGKWVRLIRKPMPGFVAFGSMQSDLGHLGKFKNAFKTREGFAFAGRRFARYLMDLLRYGKGANLAHGNALIGRLVRSCLDAGVTLWHDSPAVKLAIVNGKVEGVVVRRDGLEYGLKARRGVVLATGGFGGNDEMIRQFMPMPSDHIAVHPESNTGDGIALGKLAGGALPEPNPDNGVWAPVSVMRDASGKVMSKYPHFGLDRGKPGSLIVDTHGKRFANEASPYQDFVNVMVENHVGTAWFIADPAFLRSYGMGIVLPAPLPFKKFVKNGYLIEAPSLSALAKKLKLDSAELERTVQRFNTSAAKGVDPDFGRGSNIYDNAQGDFDNKPNPNLRPIGEGPYYAIALHPGNVSTVYGFSTSVDAEVLREDGSKVPGLFAVGLDQNTVMKGFYPGGGSSIGPGMTFGYRAALRMAATTPTSSIGA